ncbi:general substrate transporter, partial [Sporormia fimetaria CBS 119925]
EEDEHNLHSLSVFVWVLAICAGLSGLLFGYDTGVISSTLVSINSDLSSRPLSTLDKSLITSCTSLAALFASPFAGVFADHYGRKPVILFADILFIVGALWQAASQTVWMMIVGRSIVGLAVAAASCIGPLYISELAPGPFRGRLVVVGVGFISGGQVVAYLIGWAFSRMDGGWRWMVGLGAVPAVLQIAMMVFLPETPRWLVKSGDKRRARRVLLRVYGADRGALVDGILKKVVRETMEEEEMMARRGVHDTDESGFRAEIRVARQTFLELVTVPSNRRALLIACFLQGFQQLSGFNSLMYYSATIFSLVGFTNPTLTSLTIATTNLLFTLVAFHTIDRLGRRRTLLSSIPFMVLGLVLAALSFTHLSLSPTSSPTSPPSTPSTPGAWSYILTASLILYVSAYALGIGNIPWQQSELFPLSVRGQGSAIATAVNWAANFVVGVTFLKAMEALTPQGTFAVYAGVCA